MKLVQKRSRKAGLPPGTPVHIGEKKADKVTITAFNYAGARCDERQDLSLDVLAPPTDESVTWVNVGGVHKMDGSRKSPPTIRLDSPTRASGLWTPSTAPRPW